MQVKMNLSSSELNFKGTFEKINTKDSHELEILFIYEFN